MTTVLTDAEYSRLDPAKRAQYWHNRFEDLQEQYDHLKTDRDYLRTLLSEVETIAKRYKP